MNRKEQSVRIATVLTVFFAIMLSPIHLMASHSWNNYHWARRSNPFTLKVVDSNTPDWDARLNEALVDWSASSVMNLTKVAGDDSSRTRKRCPMVSGQIRSCNAAYGFNGWLGLASINVSGGHITQGTSKMNDSYLLSSRYSETNRQHVMCQEIGHDFGLGHTSEDGSDQNTCMDYSNDLGNRSPNNHDYTMIESIYAHLDSTTTIGLSAFGSSESNENPNNWGQLMSQSANGRSSTYERANPDNSRTITHVFWTQERAERCPGCDHRFHD